MNETRDLPERRPMPEALRDRLWDEEIEPQLEPKGFGRFKGIRAPLAVAAAVVLLAVGVVFALPYLRGRSVEVAAGPDSELVRECVQAGWGASYGGPWRAGARLDLDATHGFLVIRNDRTAAACVIDNGKGTGIIGGTVDPVDLYGKLNAARPFDYLTSMNYTKESVHFGIASADVVTVSLVASNNSSTPGVVRDGTFIVRTAVPENSNQTSTNYVEALLANGKTVSGPLRR